MGGAETAVKAKLARDLSYIDAYMDEYYASLTRENLEIGRFLAEAASGLPDLGAPKRIVDVACGPSALYWALFMKGFDEHHGVDAREENMAHVRGEVAASAHGEMPGRYQDVCAAVAGSHPGPVHPHFADVCKRFKSLVSGDLRSTWPFPDGFADVVTSIFGIEHLDTMEDFRRALGEVRRILKPGGRFVFVNLCMTGPWRFRGEPIHVLPLTESSLAEEVRRAGFGEVSVERRAATTAVELDQGYDAMLFGTAMRAS